MAKTEYRYCDNCEDEKECSLEYDGYWYCAECSELCAEDSRDVDYPDGDDIHFADPGGNSALRAATRDNPRNLPCPSCGESDRLTPADVDCGYQCDSCADQAEQGGY
jgi:ribosomal protein L37AE/L43A